ERGQFVWAISGASSDTHHPETTYSVLHQDLIEARILPAISYCSSILLTIKCSGMRWRQRLQRDRNVEPAKEILNPKHPHNPKIVAIPIRIFIHIDFIEPACPMIAVNPLVGPVQGVGLVTKRGDEGALVLSMRPVEMILNCIAETSKAKRRESTGRLEPILPAPGRLRTRVMNACAFGQSSRQSKPNGRPQDSPNGLLNGSGNYNVARRVLEAKNMVQKISSLKRLLCSAELTANVAISGASSDTHRPETSGSVTS
ncbi:16804_t:CDS:2, partial [Acaulospora colombiana]